jgi:hypothetical protein
MTGKILIDAQGNLITRVEGCSDRTCTTFAELLQQFLGGQITEREERDFDINVVEVNRQRIQGE